MPCAAGAHHRTPRRRAAPTPTRCWRPSATRPSAARSPPPISPGFSCSSSPRGGGCGRGSMGEERWAMGEDPRFEGRDPRFEVRGPRLGDRGPLQRPRHRLSRRRHRRLRSLSRRFRLLRNRRRLRWLRRRRHQSLLVLRGRPNNHESNLAPRPSNLEPRTLGLGPRASIHSSSPSTTSGRGISSRPCCTTRRRFSATR